MFNHNQSSWTFDQHKAYAAEQERRARQHQQAEEARQNRRSQQTSNEQR
jgi:hypothetical protein